VLHALLGMPQGGELLNQPWVGASWEGWIIEQIVSAFAVQNTPVFPFWFRTSDQKEADLVLEFNGRRWVLEIKLTTLPKQDDLKKAQEIARLVKAEKAIRGNRTNETSWGDASGSVNLDGLLQKTRALVL